MHTELKKQKERKKITFAIPDGQWQTMHNLPVPSEFFRAQHPSGPTTSWAETCLTQSLGPSEID